VETFGPGVARTRRRFYQGNSRKHMPQKRWGWMKRNRACQADEMGRRSEGADTESEDRCAIWSRVGQHKAEMFCLEVKEKGG